MLKINFFIVFILAAELCQPPEPLYPVISMVYGLAQCTVRRRTNHVVTTSKQTEVIELEDLLKTSPLKQKDLVLNGDEKAGPKNLNNTDDEDDSVITPSVDPQLSFTADNHEEEQTSTAGTEEFFGISLSNSDANEYLNETMDQPMHCKEGSNEELVVEMGDWNAGLESYCGKRLTVNLYICLKSQSSVEASLWFLSF